MNPTNLSWFYQSEQVKWQFPRDKCSCVCTTWKMNSTLLPEEMEGEEITWQETE